MPSSNPLRRIQDILHSIEKIEVYVSQSGSIANIVDTEDAFHDGVERRLLIISEAAVKLTGDVEPLEPNIRWDEIRGMGNQLRHNYDEISGPIIRAVLTTHLPLLKAACLRLKTHFSED